MAELVCGTGDRDAWLAARRAGITATDLPDLHCPGCGHGRGTDCGCSCAGPRTCGGGTDGIE